MGRFTSDEGVDLRFGDAINLGTRGAGDDGNSTGLFRTEIEGFYRAAENGSEFADKNIARHGTVRLEPNRLAFFFQEPFRRLQSQGGGELSIVANFGMHIERQMRTDESDIVFKRDF